MSINVDYAINHIPEKLDLINMKKRSTQARGKYTDVTSLGVPRAMVKAATYLSTRELIILKIKASGTSVIYVAEVSQFLLTSKIISVGIRRRGKFKTQSYLFSNQ